MYLQTSKVADKPIDYKWDVRLQNRIVASDADRKPALANAVGKIGVKAAFAFGVASAEWVVARLSQQTDVTDALQRIDAAWAATVDPQYARLPDPQKVDPATVNPAAARPVYIAMAVLSDLHARYVAGRADKVYMDAYILALLAEHVAGRNPVFKQWAPDVLKRLQKQHPKSAQPGKEASVARETLQANAPPKVDLTASQATLLGSLNPSRNRYLAPAADLIKAGVSEEPYPRKS
jgi:hypothetical protein